MTHFKAMILASALAACAASGVAQEPGAARGLDFQKVRNATGDALSDTGSGIAGAAMIPLNDLNLRREKIPDTLETLDSYQDKRTPLVCSEIAGEIALLDETLGPENQGAPDKSISEKLAGRASGVVVDSVAGEVKGLIPFRGTLRKITGAQAHEKRVRAAIALGGKRRAYLHGAWEALACDARPDDRFGLNRGPAAAGRPLNLPRSANRSVIEEAPLSDPYPPLETISFPPSDATAPPEASESAPPKSPSLG